MTPKKSEKRLRETAWGDRQQQERRGGIRAMVWAVEWVALLLGFLPFGGRRARWQRPKTVLALAAAGIAFTLNATFIATYFEKNLQRLHKKIPRMLYFSGMTNYTVFALGSFVMLPVLWLQSSSLAQLFDTLRAEHSLSNAVAGRRLPHSVFSFLFASLDFITCVIIQVLWNEDIYQMQFDNVVFMASAMYSFFLIPSIHTFPIVLMVTAIHVLHVALEDTNEALQHQFSPRHADPAEPETEHRHWDKEYILRALRVRYVHLRHTCQAIADIFAAPLIIWTLNITFQMVQTIFDLLSFSGVEYKRIAVVVEGLLSLFLLGHLTDGITVQAAAPQSIILDGNAATEPEKTQPEVVVQVVMLLKASEIPLVIRPWGLYTVSRSNLLAVVMAMTSFIVVLLQFNMDDLTSAKTGATTSPPGNTSTNCTCP